MNGGFEIMFSSVIRLYATYTMIGYLILYVKRLCLLMIDTYRLSDYKVSFSVRKKFKIFCNKRRKNA